MMGPWPPNSFLVLSPCWVSVTLAITGLEMILFGSVQDLLRSLVFKILLVFIREGFLNSQMVGSKTWVLLSDIFYFSFGETKVQREQGFLYNHRAN